MRTMPWLAGPITALALVCGAAVPAAEPGCPSAGRAACAPTHTGYQWPLQPVPVVVRAFDGRGEPFGPGHLGVDLAGEPGRPVLAARGGSVVFAGMLAGRGVVSVQHDDGLRTTYEPVDPRVRAGQLVTTGAVLGLLLPGHPGCPGTCLHWGARRDRLDHIDPLVLVRPRQVRLLPVPAQWPPW